MAKDLEYYQGLTTSQHRELPKYQGTIANMVRPFLDLQGLADQTSRNFDLDHATGRQLDVIAEWVGISRRFKSTITGVYFEFDGASEVGWDSGTWKGQFDPDAGLGEMSDEALRRLIRIKIKVNRWDGSFEALQAMWDEFLPEDRLGVIIDWQDMSIAFGYEGSPITGVDEAVMLLALDLLKPAAVLLREVFYAVDGSPLFLWDSGSGWDTATWSAILS